MKSILSPFMGKKIQFENYNLTTEDDYASLVKRVFSSVKIENTNEAMEIPFPRMTSTDIAVWQEYCPTHQKLEDANIALHDGALGLIEKYAPKFDVMEVWYEAGDQVDPILVGKKYRNEEERQKGYTWNMQSFLLCRWGEALKEFKEIKKQVFSAYVMREKMRLQRDLNNLEMDAMQRFGFAPTSSSDVPF